MPGMDHLRRVSATRLLAYLGILFAGLAAGVALDRFVLTSNPGPVTGTSVSSVPAASSTNEQASPTDQVVTYNAIVLSVAEDNVTVVLPDVRRPSTNEQLQVKLTLAAGGTAIAVIPKTTEEIRKELGMTDAPSSGPQPPLPPHGDDYKRVPIKLSDLKKNDIITFTSVGLQADATTAVASSIILTGHLESAAGASPGAPPIVSSPR
jgi:hypothetical protein